METRLEQSQDDYRRLADELRLQREQAQLLEQRLKQQHEEQQREEWEEQQNRMEDRFGEYYSLIRGILLQQSSQEVRSKFAKGLLDNFVSKAEPKKPEEIREGVLRFVERRRSSSSRMNNNSRSNRWNSSDKNNRSNHHDKRMGKKVV